MANCADGQNLSRKWVTHSESESCLRSQDILKYVLIFRDILKYVVGDIQEDRSKRIRTSAFPLMVVEVRAAQSSLANQQGKRTTSPGQSLLSGSTISLNFFSGGSLRFYLFL